MTRALRETIGTDLAGASLSWDRAGAEAPIDRVVASAWTGERLGRLLTRLKYAHECSTTNLRTALWLIVGKVTPVRGIYGRGKPTDRLIGHCAAALEEWLNDRCTDCRAGWQRPGPKPTRCRTCHGAGLVAWTDDQRAAKLAPELVDPKLYERILRRLQEADNRHNNRTRRGLTP